MWTLFFQRGFSFRQSLAHLGNNGDPRPCSLHVLESTPQVRGIHTFIRWDVVFTSEIFSVLRTCVLGVLTCIRDLNHDLWKGSLTFLWDNKISDLSALVYKAFADNKINVIKKLKFVSEWVESMVGIAFPPHFQKASYTGLFNPVLHRYSF